MLRIAEDVGVGADLDDPAHAHDGYPVADTLHHCHVVRDEQVGKAELLLKFDHQIDDLRLDGNIQRRDRLVGDDDLRRQRQGASDAQALALAAGKFMRVTVKLIGREPHPFCQADNLVAQSDALLDVMNDQGFGHLVKSRKARIERGIRVLKDDLHVASPRLQA